MAALRFPMHIGMAPTHDYLSRGRNEIPIDREPARRNRANIEVEGWIALIRAAPVRKRAGPKLAETRLKVY